MWLYCLLTTRASVWVIGHGGGPSAGEGRTPAHAAAGYRQTSLLSLRQVCINGEPSHTFICKAGFVLTMSMALWSQCGVNNKRHRKHLNSIWENKFQTLDTFGQQHWLISKILCELYLAVHTLVSHRFQEEKQLIPWSMRLNVQWYC